jgi:hypothetical protein
MTILPNDILHQVYAHLSSITDDDGWCAYLLRPVTMINEAWELVCLPENEGLSIVDFEYWPMWSVWGEDGTHSA